MVTERVAGCTRGFDRRWRAGRRRAGFTFIELMLGVLILLLAVSGLLGAFMGLSMLNATARRQTLAVHDANRRMEALRNMAYGSLPSGTTTSAAWSAELARLSGTVTTIPATVSTGLKRMTVRVSWTERGQVRQVELESLFTDRSR